MTIDWDAFRRAGYEKARQLAKTYYDSIGSIPCPVLGHEPITFNAQGFRHLVRKKERRTRMDQRRRFALLRYVREVIEDRGVVVMRRYVRGDIDPSDQGEIRYWGLEKEYGSFSIRVVIRQIGRGNKHFYSIMRR